MGVSRIKQRRLAVLIMQLDLSERTPAITAEFVGYPHEKARTFWKKRYPPAEFGLPKGTAAPTELFVPDGLRDDVVRSLDESFLRDAALWLRLVPPYGYLGAVPWERVLVEATGKPLVRVPDRLPVAADPGQVWSLAIAVDADPGSDWAAEYCASLLSAIYEYVSASITADVFVDAGTYDVLKELITDVPPAMELRLHEPDEAIRAHQNRTERGVPQFRRQRSAGPPAPPVPGSALIWADWIAAGLGSRAVRALHLVSDAAFDADRPLLMLSPDPRDRAESHGRAYASADDVRLLADTIGASALSLGSPPKNPSDIATRMMADALGVQRPSPTFYSCAGLDPSGNALAWAHAFIADLPGTVSIPQDPSLFLYLQPEHIQASLAQKWPEPRPSKRHWLPGRRESAAAAAKATPPSTLPPALDVAPNDALSAYYASAETVPGWVASAERYIDGRLADLAGSAAPPGEASAVKEAYDLGTAKALNELRGLIERNVK